MMRTLREVGVLVAVPLMLVLCAWLQIQQAALLTMLVALGALVVLFADFEASRPQLRDIMPAAVLGALAAALRMLFAPFPSVKPVSALCIMAGIVFGRRTGFMVGALAALVSNMFFGQGPWTPWQMYAWGLIGYLAGVMGQAWEMRSSRSVVPRSLVLAFGAASGILYGFILNSWYVVGFVNPLTWPAALAAYAAGLPFDLTHSAATVVFLALLYLPWDRKLRRIAQKYGLHS